MRVLKLLSNPDVLAGTERTTHVGSRALRELGAKVFLLHDQIGTPVSASGYDGELGAPALFNGRSKFPPRGLHDAEARVDQFIQTHKIDLIHVHSYPRSGPFSRLARRHCTVVGVHVPLCPNGSRYLWNDRRPCDRTIGLGCLTVGFCRKGCGHLGNGMSISPHAFMRMMVTDYRRHRIIGGCARVIANSHWMRRQLIKDGLSPGIMRVVRAPMEDLAEASEWTVPEQPPVVLFVGRLVDFKAPDHLLKASARINRPHRVWVVGDGPLRLGLERLAVSLGIGGRVTFHGEVGPGKLAELRRHSTLAVVPSVWPENFGRSGPESLLARRPVVGYAAGGIPEWLIDGVNGRLVPVGDIPVLASAIEQIISDPQLARVMGETGAHDAAKWLEADHGAKLLEVYREAVLYQRRRMRSDIVVPSVPLQVG